MVPRHRPRVGFCALASRGHGEWLWVRSLRLAPCGERSALQRPSR